MDGAAFVTALGTLTNDTVAAPTQASNTDVYCGGEIKKGHFRYVFTDFEKMDEIVRGGTGLGIVLPLAAGEFKAVRFELTGATTAIDTMLKSAASIAAKDKRGTRDVRL